MLALHSMTTASLLRSATVVLLYHIIYYTASLRAAFDDQYFANVLQTNDTIVDAGWQQKYLLLLLMSTLCQLSSRSSKDWCCGQIIPPPRGMVGMMTINVLSSLASNEVRLCVLWKMDITYYIIYCMDE